MDKLADDILICILKYGYIEDIVSKERISVRFGQIVMKVVSKMDRFPTKSRPIATKRNGLINSGIFETIKKMPSLTDVSNMKFDSWTFDQVKELSRINQGITHFNRSNRGSRKVLYYIRCVRGINPDFKGQNIRQSFDRKAAEYRDCIKRFPDLDLKVAIDGEDIIRHKVESIGHLSFRDSSDHINGTVLPNVTTVELDTFFFRHFDDLRSLPNLKELTLDYVSSATTKKAAAGYRNPSFPSHLLAQVNRSLPPTLRRLNFHCRSKWIPEDLPALKSIIENLGLVSLVVTYPRAFGRSFPIEDVMESVVNSPMRTLNELQLPNLKLHKVDASTTLYLFDKFGDVQILDGLLRRFRKVTKVSISTYLMDKQLVDIERLKEMCRQVVDTDRRRTLLLNLPNTHDQFIF